MKNDDDLILVICMFIMILAFCSAIIYLEKARYASKNDEYLVVYHNEPQMICEELPYHLFDDPEPSVKVHIATPQPMIDGMKKVEEQKNAEPKMMYYGGMYMTAYIETGSPCADGIYPEVGWTAACNDPALWHKKVYIEGFGTRYIHDTGAMDSNVIDVFVGSYDEAIQFGCQYREVYIYD